MIGNFKKGFYGLDEVLLYKVAYRLMYWLKMDAFTITLVKANKMPSKPVVLR